MSVRHYLAPEVSTDGFVEVRDGSGFAKLACEICGATVSDASGRMLDKHRSWHQDGA